LQLRMQRHTLATRSKARRMIDTETDTGIDTDADTDTEEGEDGRAERGCLLAGSPCEIDVTLGLRRERKRGENEPTEALIKEIKSKQSECENE